ncbi:endonuclease/exonuclease/phosphatase family protein [Nocardioides sp. MAHUQ-72]|uniref:endonuclease/exonuclease/phosphatase family protein n=1 Tax=unclassified Nocardioides TaxID=2615069 RepID=UPI00361657FF
MLVRAATSLFPALVLLLAGLTPQPALAGSAGPVTVPLRVGSYNIRAAEPVDSFEAGVEALRPRIDVAGLQEITGRDKLRYLAATTGWASYSALEQMQNPVIWDRSKLAFVSGRGALLAKGRYIGDELPKLGDHTKDTYATIVHLRHILSGRSLTVINVHLLAGATQAGRPRADRPLMFSEYRDQVRSLDALVAAESSSGQVIVLGDFNVGYAADARWQRKNFPYTRLTKHAMVGMWRDCGTDDNGTHGRQYIDQVWTDVPAASCEVGYDIQHSDHYPVVGTYAVDVLPG